MLNMYYRNVMGRWLITLGLQLRHYGDYLNFNQNDMDV